MLHYPAQTIVHRQAAAHLELVLRVDSPCCSAQVAVRIRESERRGLRNAQQKISIADPGIVAVEVVGAVDVGCNVVPVEAVPDNIEPELEKMPPSSPTYVLDPLERGLRVGLVVVGVCVRIPGCDSVDGEVGTCFH